MADLGLRLLLVFMVLLISLETYESKLLQSISIPHDAPVGYSLTKLNDNDANNFIDLANENFKDLFQRTKDGAITIKRKLSDLAGTTINVPVKNAFTNAISDILHIKIVKFDTFVFPQKKYVGTIKENKHPGSHVKIIGHLAVTDAGYKNLTYSLLSANHSFAVNYISYGNSHDNRIIALKSFDRESRQRYSFLLQAEAVTGELALTEIEVHILDDNDNIPRFQQSVLEVTATSGPNWNSIVTVEALDDDLNDRISYFLTGSGDFVIDSDTGEIFSEEDYLFVGNYLLKVYANDSAGHISDPLIIHIHVDSENSALLFMPRSYHHVSKRATTTISKLFVIVENSTSVSSLFSVATTQPRPASSTEEYGLISSSVDIFQQPDRNGNVYLKPGRVLDYEDPSHREILLIFNRTNMFSPGGKLQVMHLG